ncbi:MAG: hypothetical protein KGI37_02435 [Alphaproteobacteria bacterium]|nr:hypothetical protein [Alphaproteobacteria bacterium]
MTSPQAILIGAAMIAASILVVNSVRPAEAQRLGAGLFELMHHSNTAANAGVFRLNTETGEVSYCYITGDQNLTCSAAVK